MNVTEASQVLWDKGERILQGNRLGLTDAEHIEQLARYMHLNGERRIVDMGCGFGEVSRLLGEIIPQSKFLLVNNNAFQISKCPLDAVQEDMCATSIPAGSADLVMFNWSICHVNIPDALKEAARITKDHGRLFVYDYERVAGDNRLTMKLLNANFIGDSEFRSFCKNAGWHNVDTTYPGGDDSLFREAFADDVLYDEVIQDFETRDMESDKIAKSRDLILRGYVESDRPAAMLSFGKDSMVLAHLIRETIKRDEWSAHGFPVQVIYHRDPWFPWKHEFADKIIRSWSMEVHDFPPFQTGVKTKEDMIELVARYNFGSGAMDIPKNTLPPEAYPRRDYICGLNDWMLRPKNFLLDYPWDTVFIGHRSADVDPFEGAVPLNTDDTVFGDVRMMFPLKDWSDKEVWDYIEEHKIPMQPTRYRASDDRWYTNDYTHACTACIDPREDAIHVWCPKANKYVRNRGGEVLQLHARPPYVEREA